MGKPMAFILVCLLGAPLTSLGTAPEVERIATMVEARAVHAAAALPDGGVLVSGGMGRGGRSMRSAERIDPASGRVEPLADMAEARAGHTATALPDGRVAIAGGYDGSYLASVEVFDPFREVFATLGRLLEGRSGHTSTLLPDGRILVVGGVGRGWSFLATAEAFDPRTGMSEPMGSMAVARESHTATLLADGRVLVVGGHRGRRESMEVHASAELFDPTTGLFTPAGTMVTARHKHDALLLADGRVLVLGGADRTDRRFFASTEIFDPSRGRFVPGPPMRSARYKFQGTTILLPSGDVLVSAGATRAEVLDRHSREFRSVAGGFPDTYSFATATLVRGGDVLIAGGYSGPNLNTDGVWRFRPE